MNDVICQSEIDQGVLINIVSKIIIITGEAFVQTVVVIQHTGYTVKSKAVNVVLVQPPAAITSQKVQYFRFAIIKQPRIPYWMIVSLEILRRVACEITEAFDFIFGGMSMNNVNDDAQPQSVRRVN